MFNLINRGELHASTEHEFENFASRLKNLWLTEHHEDGTHDLPASSIPGLDASKIISGTFVDARIPNLDASKITTGTFAKVRLPAAIAYEDEANTFTLNQLISKTRPYLEFLHSGTSKARVGGQIADQALLSRNISFDGTNINLDDTSLTGSLLEMSAGNGFRFWGATAGANPRTLTQLVQIDASGNIVCNQLQPAANVKFPATQNASGDANTLDDYEEGTFTPTLSGSGGNSGQTWTLRVGFYNKIGNLVYFSAYLVLNAVGSFAGSMLLDALPFTAHGTTNGFSAITCSYWTTLNTNWTYIAAHVNPSTTYAYIVGTTAAASGVTQMVSTDVKAGSGFIFSGCYRASA